MTSRLSRAGPAQPRKVPRAVRHPAIRRASTRVKVDDVDYDAFRTRPLSAEALRTLRYMSDVESHTICYLRDLLVTPSHKDPEVTAFLTHWAFEEFWHGEALDQVLRVHGQDADYRHIRKVRHVAGTPRPARADQPGRSRRTSSATTSWPCTCRGAPSTSGRHTPPTSG